MKDEERAILQLAIQERKRLAKVLATPDGEKVLRVLEARFQVHLPAFQGSVGQYDPLDAMRRDAHREVFLHIRHQLQLAQQEYNNHE